MSTALIYYYFDYSGRKPWENLWLPIIQSIATFRYWEADCPVWVVDVSADEIDWGDYPDLLNFKVHRRPHHLRYIEFDTERLPWTSPHLLSKPGDIYNFSLTIPEETLLVCDLDMFFLQPPNPFSLAATDKMICNGNAGYWMYNKQNNNTDILFHLWQSHCAQGMLDDRFRDRACKESNKHFMQEETVLCYLLRYFPDFFTSTDPQNNVSIRDVAEGRVDPSTVRTLHVHNCNSLAYPKERTAWRHCVSRRSESASRQCLAQTA